jgi:hypothetical protein
VIEGRLVWWCLLCCRRKSSGSYDDGPMVHEGRGPCSLLWGDDHLERSANERWTDDSTRAASVALDVTPRENEELQRLGSVDQAGKAKSTRPTIQP